MSTDAPLLTPPAAPLAVDPALLPDDPTVLKQLVAQLCVEIQKHVGRVEQLEHQMTLLLRRLYGVKSEKLDPRQGTLFEEPAAEDAAAPVESAAAAASESTVPDESAGDEPARAKRKGAHGRGRLPDSLQRVELIHDLSDAEKEALGGAENLKLIGREVTEQLEWKPSSLFVIQHVQLTYARQDQLPESGERFEDKNVVTAAKPPQPIPGGLPGPGLIAQVIVSKACDHIPWNRLERIFARHGLEISRQTTCGWSLAAAEVLEPLYKLMLRETLASLVLHADDTPVAFRDAYNKVQRQTYFWTYVGDARHPFTVFDFTLDHTRDGPSKFLKNFRGHLQADAAGLYDGLYTEPDRGIVEVGCWMHARRKFFEARDKDRLRAETALAYIAKLYQVEKELRQWCMAGGTWHELPLDEQYVRIAADRQARSKPLLDAFHTWLEAEAPKVLPKHPLREAMNYALRHWLALGRYVEHGMLDIDNGEAERALRGIALGRKNWLFCASERGGRAAAVHFSFVASCRRHNHDPFVYLRDVLTRLPLLGVSPTPEQLRELLPDCWKPASHP
jgi:transposase